MKKQVRQGQVRQGDVMIERIESIPASAKRVKARNGRLVLADGEATGHCHTLPAADCELYEDDHGTLHVRVKKPVEVDHQEHARIPLEPDNYRVTRQREYTPEEIRNVAD